jgi:hypothetical protein
MKRKRRRSHSPPGLGRNLAVRPGGGPHVPDEEKRASDRIRREIDEELEDLEDLEEPEDSREPREV